jgi:glycosyltransferase involved in cell wall biosynthesis
LVGPAYADAFAQWLRCVVREAELIFTSTEIMREQFYRWALAEGLAPRYAACTIPFGPSLLRIAEPATSPIVTDPFVLSVGTIDPRKNQLFLDSAWVKLAAEHELPVLVLVGRDDLGLLNSAPPVAPLVASRRIRIPTGVDDAALNALYRAALFTVFPSLIDGHGLPVSGGLAYGKLCVAADLAVIREHAADLPWYFPSPRRRGRRVAPERGRPPPHRSNPQATGRRIVSACELSRLWRPPSPPARNL